MISLCLAYFEELELTLVSLNSKLTVLDVPLEDLGSDVLIVDLISHEHLAATARQAQLRLLLLSLPQGGLLCQVLELLQALLVLLILFLHLIADQSHVLTSPYHWQLVRRGGRASQHIRLLYLLRSWCCSLTRPCQAVAIRRLMRWLILVHLLVVLLNRRRIGLVHARSTARSPEPCSI